MNNIEASTKNEKAAEDSPETQTSTVIQACPVIQACNINKVFAEGDLKVEVLKNVDFTVEKGEQVAIVGASGSGKSTLMHIIGGLDEPTSGDVSIDGNKLFKMADKKRAALRNQFLGFVYQFHHLLPEFSALENVAMPLLIRGEKVQVAREAAAEILARVGLKDRTEHKPAEMSGGERQRAAIARSLVANPACVLADEPTGNLDSKTADMVYSIMLDLNREFQTSFVVVTHDYHLAQKMDRVLTIKDGVLQQL